MALTTEEILIKIRTEEQGFDKINQEVKQLEDRLNRLQSNPKGNVSNFGWFKDQKTTLENGKIAIQQYNTELANKSGANAFKTNSELISGSVTGLISGFASLKTVQKLWEMSLTSKKLDVMRSYFKGSEQDIKNFKTATANTVAEASLIKLSNQATDLGISLKDQTILFSLAKDASEKYGTTVEEGFNRVVMATEGNILGLKSLGIQKEVYEQTVKDLAKAHGDNINNLDAETQKQIRLEAIIKASGTTFEDATNKIQNEADKQESIFVMMGNFVSEYGATITNILVPASFVLENMGDAVSKLKDKWNEFRITNEDISNTLNDVTLGLIGIRKEAEDPIKINIEVNTKVSDLTKNIWSVLYGQDLSKIFEGSALGWGEIRDKDGNIIPFAQDAAKDKSKPPKGKKEKEKDLNDIAALEKKLAETQIDLDEAVANNWKGLIEKKTEEIRKLKIEIDELKKGFTFVISPEELQGQLERTIESIKPILIPVSFEPSGLDVTASEDKWTEYWENYYDAIASEDEVNQAMADAFTQSLDIASQISTIFGGAADEIINAFRTAYSLANSIASFISSIISIISMFTPAGVVGAAVGAVSRAGGGDVVAGTLYRVNENETEYFKSNVSGTIIPLMANQGSQNIQIEPVNVSIKGEDIAIVFGRVEGKKNNYVSKAYAG